MCGIAVEDRRGRQLRAHPVESRPHDRAERQVGIRGRVRAAVLEAQLGRRVGAGERDERRDAQQRFTVALGQADGAGAPAVGRKARGRRRAGSGQRAERARVQQDAGREALAELAQARRARGVVERGTPAVVEQAEMDVHAVARPGGVQQRREARAQLVLGGRARARPP